MKPDPLKNLRIASPCPMNWEQMTGDDRARFCSLCNLHVYNIAELTRKQAKALITQTEGRICGRIYRRSDGTVITRDCPIGLRAIRRRVARVSGAVFATLVALSSSVFGQKPSKKDDPACKQQVTISRKISDTESGNVTGTLLDPNGVVLAGARIMIAEGKSGKSVITTSNDEGSFRAAAVGAGVYDLVVELPGFKKLELKQVTLGVKEDVNLTMILAVDAITVLIGIVAEAPMIDTSTSTIRNIITRDTFLRLPIQ